MTQELTPMMKQYFSVKEQYPDAILFYRLGDFYEMFHDDAVKASKLLDLTLTSRNKNSEDKVPMCGIPAHSSQGYIHKLLGSGLKVAICEQLEDPSTAKGIVKREVVQILTPGVVLDPECLESKVAHYLVSLHSDSICWALAKCDISTGQFVLAQFQSEDNLLAELSRIEPKEMILSTAQPESLTNKIQILLPSVRIDIRPAWCFQTDYATEMYERVFESQYTGLFDMPLATIAGGALLGYLHENKVLKKSLIQQPRMYQQYDYLVVDEMAKRNLELLRTQPDGNKYGSLFWLLDQAKTSMGSRLIREWILYPLQNKKSIEDRQDVVAYFCENSNLRSEVRAILSDVADLERLINRALSEQAGARDLLAIAESLKVIPLIRNLLTPCHCTLLESVKVQLVDLTDLSAEILNMIVSEPPFLLKEGGLIREGLSVELDELRNIERNSLSLISEMEAVERSQTGIATLKIRYNRVFGYYIEITNSNKDKVPENYIRKQTLANAERYITPELKSYEDKVLGATEKTKQIEYDLFVSLRKKVSTYAAEIKVLSGALAQLDALLSLSVVAQENRYVRPELSQDIVLEISRGRHPLVEVVHNKEAFIPNDVFLDRSGQFVLIITGPNMAGKSTVMRQTALITLMAHVGSFVPADKAVIGLTDRIFTRIGASDLLQKGQSTFMVEMIETAQILSNATSRSLIILDEIGRGTSTFDGLSIAWAVAETIHSNIKARTLFATHYHELTDLAESHRGIVNYHMAVKEWNSDIRFLRELKKGGTNRSLGVHVAKMAGLPHHTVSRAREILALLEKKDLSFSSEAMSQPSLFDPINPASDVINELCAIDVNQLTPMQALQLLYNLKEKLVTT